jgi:diacylglycerol O-acyltransferase
VIVIAWLCWVYDAINNLAPLRRTVALAHARGVLNLERSLHLDPERTLNHWLAGHHTLGLALADYYDNAHFVMTLGLLGWLWWRRADLYPPLRDTLVLINLLGFMVFWLYPVAPPRMLPGFSDVVASTHAFGSWHTGSLATAANQLAAMPSLHIAWASWCVLVLWRCSRSAWIRGLGIAHLALTALAVLSTGNHFLLDALAGLLTTVLAVVCANVARSRLELMRGRRRGRAQTSH